MSLKEKNWLATIQLFPVKIISGEESQGKRSEDRVPQLKAMRQIFSIKHVLLTKTLLQLSSNHCFRAALQSFTFTNLPKLLRNNGIIVTKLLAKAY